MAHATQGEKTSHAPLHRSTLHYIPLTRTSSPKDLCCHAHRTSMCVCQRAANMFKLANFKSSMLSAVKGKISKMVGQLHQQASEGKNGETIVDMQVRISSAALQNIALM